MSAEISKIEVGGRRDDEQGHKVEKSREAEAGEFCCGERRRVSPHDIGVYAGIENQAQESEENRMLVSSE